MSALTYRSTTHPIPNCWPIHVDHPRGIAYETQTHFVHLFGRSNGLWVVSSGLTVTERKTGTLKNWVVSRFGAVDIEAMVHQPGEVVDCVWRPGLFFDSEILQGLGNSLSEVRSAERTLLNLMQRLDDILNFVEPSSHGLDAYGHKTRELLILASTEVEDQWVKYLRRANVNLARYTTNDYVKLNAPLALSNYEISMPSYPSLAPLKPFSGWTASAPTQSLPWYDAYNKAKHDRTTHFADCTLRRSIEAVAANIVLFCARFGPFFLVNGQGTMASQFNQMFSVSLFLPDPKTFYTPLLEIPTNQRHDPVLFNSADITRARTSLPLTV